MDQALVGQDGYLNGGGLDHLIELLGHLEPDNHGKAFVPLVKALGLVPAGVEIILVRDAQVYLTYRDDEYFTGWHTPGGYLHQGEEYEDAVKRIAERELDCNVQMVAVLGEVNHTATERFHDVSILVLCQVSGEEPHNGKWFAKCPEDLLVVQAMYWPIIEKALA